MSATALQELSPERRRIELDFLRGIAILLVMGAHYKFPDTSIWLFDAPVAVVNKIGGIGVDLFFALSGFLVGGLLLKELRDTGTVRARRFLVRRAFKIWPALYVLVLFHVIIHRHPLDTFLWQNLFHVQNYFGTSITQTWSLAVEEHFYLLLAGLLALMAAKTPGRIFYTLLGICIAVAVLRFGAVWLLDGPPPFFQTQYRMDELMYGVILALVHHFYPAHFQRLAGMKVLLTVASASVFLWACFAPAQSPWADATGFIIKGVGFSLLLVLVYSHSGRLARFAGYRLVAWIGVYSYGIYLWHSLGLAPGGMVVRMLEARGAPALLTWLIAGIVQFGIGITLGYIMTKAVEWPFLRLREKFFPAKPGSGEGKVGSVATTAGQLRPVPGIGDANARRATRPRPEKT